MEQQLSPLKLYDVFFFLSLCLPQLPLLKALIDRLLQGGVEELLQVLGSTAAAKADDDAGDLDIVPGHAVRKSAKNINISVIGARPSCRRREFRFYFFFCFLGRV